MQQERHRSRECTSGYIHVKKDNRFEGLLIFVYSKKARLCVATVSHPVRSVWGLKCGAQKFIYFFSIIHLTSSHIRTSPSNLWSFFISLLLLGSMSIIVNKVIKCMSMDVSVNLLEMVIM